MGFGVLPPRSYPRLGVLGRVRVEAMGEGEIERTPNCQSEGVASRGISYLCPMGLGSGWAGEFFIDAFLLPGV